MLSHHILYLIFSLVYFTTCQSTIRIGIIDDNMNSKEITRIKIPNRTFCSQTNSYLQLYWINTSKSLPNLLNKLESDKFLTNIYITRTTKLSTQLIQDFCEINHIPFINMKSFGSKTMLCSLTASFAHEYFFMPNILRVLFNYLKFNHVHRAIYIYDNEESTHLIYDLLKLMNYDEYFDDFILDIRTTIYDDVYSLLYSIESHSLHKDQVPRYVLLDLHSYDNYEKMFDKISHMGLTSNFYHYIIVSTFDACLWMNRLNFTGLLIYFDYQQRNCNLDYPQSSHMTTTPHIPSTSSVKRSSSYYRSTLSFRHDSDVDKTLNATSNLSTNSSSLFNKTNSILNLCDNHINRNEEFFTYSYFLSHLPKSTQLYSRPLFDSLNLVIQILTSNFFDCRTYRLKEIINRSMNCNYADINVFSTSKSSINRYQKQIELVGRYSMLTNVYQSCQIDEHNDSLMKKKPLSSKIYYITSIFDEPFLMLRRQTNFYGNNTRIQPNLIELRGQIFSFDDLEGYCVDLAREVCSVLNITCQFRIVPDGNFGSKNATTEIWNGMVGEIVSRKADMAIAPLTISQKRMEVVDFSKPFMNLGISVMIRKPDAQKPGVFSFMNPVSMEIWLCFSLSYFAVSVVLFLTSCLVNSGWRRRIVRRPSYRSYSYPKSVNDRRKSEIHLQRQKRDSLLSEQSVELTVSARASLRRRSRHRTRFPLQQTPNFNPNKNRKRKKQIEENNGEAVHLFGISNALFFSFASFMRQSINLVPKSFSGRIAAISWWYFSLIFVSSYTANLVAFLTVEKLVTPIETVEDLAKQHEIKYGSLRNGTTAAFFEKSNITAYQDMWAMMQRSSSEVFVGTNDEGVAKVRSSKGKYAFFIESTKNEYVNERLPCDTMKVGSELDSKGYGIATRLGSDLTEAIDIIITNLRESGFLDKLKQRWWYDRSECSKNTQDKRFSELSLSSVTGLFYIFLFGIILSCFIAFTEFLITAKTESETLNIGFREILRIKMIENMIGITINTQRQLEFGRVHHECNYEYHHEEDEMIRHYPNNQISTSQTDV
ncbi:hypothetical protein I4U23_009353 [Adineta vaga]|nr:hypothetical protein I4U23_009353 [Adineta vaga]